ncbi:hypothetical protein E4U53_000105, partial [Claviceps sorghi]
MEQKQAAESCRTLVGNISTASYIRTVHPIPSMLNVLSLASGNVPIDDGRLGQGYTPSHTPRGPSPGGNHPNGGYGYAGYGAERSAYRSATPNRKGQYSDAVLNELESQNDAQ